MGRSRRSGGNAVHFGGQLGHLALEGDTGSGECGEVPFHHLCKSHDQRSEALYLCDYRGPFRGRPFRADSVDPRAFLLCRLVWREGEFEDGGKSQTSTC